MSRCRGLNDAQSHHWFDSTPPMMPYVGMVIRVIRSRKQSVLTYSQRNWAAFAVNRHSESEHEVEKGMVLAVDVEEPDDTVSAIRWLPI